MSDESAGRSFRELLSSGFVTLPGVYNAITAKLARQAGFDALYLSGAGVTNATTGYPDIALLTLTEMAGVVNRMASRLSVPLVADGDTGYGGVANVTRTVEEFESAGAAGLILEDQVSPKRCGHFQGKKKRIQAGFSS